MENIFISGVTAKMEMKALAMLSDEFIKEDPKLLEPVRVVEVEAAILNPKNFVIKEKRVVETKNHSYLAKESKRIMPGNVEMITNLKYSVENNIVRVQYRDKVTGKVMDTDALPNLQVKKIIHNEKDYGPLQYMQYTGTTGDTYSVLPIVYSNKKLMDRNGLLEHGFGGKTISKMMVGLNHMELDDCKAAIATTMIRCHTKADYEDLLNKGYIDPEPVSKYLEYNNGLGGQTIYLKANIVIRKGKSGLVFAERLPSGEVVAIGDGFVPSESGIFTAMEIYKTGDFSRRMSLAVLQQGLKGPKYGIIDGKLVLPTVTAFFADVNGIELTDGMTVNDGNAFLLVKDTKGYAEFMKHSSARKWKFQVRIITWEMLTQSSKELLIKNGFKADTEKLLILDEAKSGVWIEKDPKNDKIATMIHLVDDVKLYMTGNRVNASSFGYFLAQMLRWAITGEEILAKKDIVFYRHKVLDAYTTIFQKQTLRGIVKPEGNVLDVTRILDNPMYLEQYQKITNRDSVEMPTEEVITYLNKWDMLKYKNFYLPIFRQRGKSVSFSFTLAFNAMVHLKRNNFNVSKCFNHLKAVQTDLLKRFVFTNFVQRAAVGEDIEIMASPIKEELKVVFNTSLKEKLTLLEKDGKYYVFVKRYPVVDKIGVFLEVEFKDNWPTEVIGIGRDTIELVDGDFDTDTLYISIDSNIYAAMFEIAVLEEKIEKMKDSREATREGALVALSAGKQLPGIVTAKIAMFAFEIYMKARGEVNKVDYQKAILKFVKESGVVLQNGIDAKKMSKDITQLCYMENGKFVGYEKAMQMVLFDVNMKLDDVCRTYENFTHKVDAENFISNDFDDVKGGK